MSIDLCEIAAEPTPSDHRIGAWSCRGFQPGVVTRPGDWPQDGAPWFAASAPGTVAAALDQAGQWDFDRPMDLDALDWWFRTSFAAPQHGVDDLQRLCFDGLATLAEVWLNGQLILTTNNSFRSYHIDLVDLRAENELAICFRSSSEDLKRKRPRPRWKTNLVRQQQLRWQRSSLLGRIPGWAPCAPTIGPWREVRLASSPVLLDTIHVRPAVDGTTGLVTVAGQLSATRVPRRASLRVGDTEASLELQSIGDRWSIVGEVRVADVPLWWPHTHGPSTTLDCVLTVETDDERHQFPGGPIGFRKLEVQTDHGFTVCINDEPIFCRGACWTVADLLSPAGDESTVRRDLQLAKDSGANMIRVGGTMNYESEVFYRLCDELGLLVWQDFMFANMDYPVEDATFHANITQEAIEQLTRLSRHPAVVVYCGNSEIEQQAAMLGLPRDKWTNDWFSSQLPELCATYHPSSAYVPSTPTGGVLPFHTHTGITHYYGVGAYLRPTSDVRSSDVKFTPECLGFANLPEPAPIFAVTGGSHPVLHDPAWKQRVPRDGGAGWDFEDVRDHYLAETHSVEPAKLRSFDMARYLELSRAVSGELMAQAFAEWRSTRSHNHGALVWFYKDLWPGAGWGVVDSTGLPKAAYYYLKRSWQSRQLTLTNEGLNGLELHLTNESPECCSGTVELTLLKEPNIVVARHAVDVQVMSRSQQRLLADALARQGIPVLRFDWHGTGDSSGSDADPARRAAWQNNVRDAVAWLRTQLGCQRVSVVGLRMGATLALEALGEHECENLVLWAPVTCGKGYMRQMQAIEQMAELRPRPDDAAAGDVEAAGFLVTEQTAEGFLKSNILRREFTCAQALVVGPADKRLVERFEQLEIPVASISPPGFAEMMAEPHFSQVPHQAVQEIAGWLSQQIERSPKAELSIALKDLGPGTATVLPHAGATSIREHVWRFGGELELFGVLSEPNEPVPGLPTIVLLNCGAANHVGPGRVNVELSRHLASIGFPTLRIDACGLGDSVAAKLADENNPYPATVFRDVQLAMNELRVRAGAKQFVLMGLCSGAYAAFQSAVQLAEPAFVESVLINPLTFYWQDGMPFDASAAIKLMQEQSTTPEPLAEPTGFWSRLQSAAKCMLGRNPSDANLDGSAAVVEDDEKLAAPLGHPPENNLSADLARLARTKRQLAMFLAENDPGLAVMKYHAPRAVKQWLDSGALRLTMIDGGDHAFSRRVPRRKLLSAVGEYLLSRYQTSG